MARTIRPSVSIGPEIQDRLEPKNIDKYYQQFTLDMFHQSR